MAERSGDGENGTRKAILVVDDDADIRQTLEMTLQYEGFEVWTARPSRGSKPRPPRRRSF
ncbi:MAG: hypothetical protein ACPGPE_05665 [Planctomycetota bacterium]